MHVKSPQIRIRVYRFEKNMRQEATNVCAALVDYGLSPEYDEAGEDVYLTIPASEMDILLFLRKMAPKNSGNMCNDLAQKQLRILDHLTSMVTTMQEIITGWQKIRQIKESHTPASELKKRGWTAAMIEEFLGSPDVLARNPVFRSGAPMCLYANARIYAAESSDSFAQRKKVRELRGDVRKKISERKKAELLAWANALEIQVCRYAEKSSLFEDALLHYNNRILSRGKFESHVDHWSRCETDFLHRITVNFLRHQCTTYEDRLEDIFGKTGVNEAYIAIKKKALEAIAIEYHFLSEECKRQIESLRQ